MECPATMTVADLVRMLGKRCSRDESKRVGAIGNKYCEDNNSSHDPVMETTTDCRSPKFSSRFIPGTLMLVRTASELNVQALVLDEVNELDILEFEIDSSCSFGPSRSRGNLRSRKISPIASAYPQSRVELERPLSTIFTLTPARQTNDKVSSMRLKCLASTKLEAPPEVDCDFGRRSEKLIQLSNGAREAFRRRARRYSTRRKRRMRLLVAQYQNTRNAAKGRTNTERILLRAGIQLIECLQLVQKGVQRLVFLLHDAVLSHHDVSTHDLLSIAEAMVKALTQIEDDRRTVPSSFSQGDHANLVRSLLRSIAGNDGGIPVVLQGWVVSAEWGTFWRSQRKEYACLCDNHVLYFFTSPTQCFDFLLELRRERDGHVSETSQRVRKDNSPLSQVDLSVTDWTVRKSFLDESHGKLRRNAFAFFDARGHVRLVLDVSTSAEATMWARAIAASISQFKLFARVRELYEESAKIDFGERKDIADPSTIWTAILSQSSAPMNDQNSLVIPLRSLYSLIDHRNGTARAGRCKSWTFGQALKDLQRDCVKVNGRVLAGNSLEANILALTLENLKCMEAGQKSTSRAGKSKALKSMNVAEMIALHFARQVIIYSSRTHGGGDIFDMLHLLFDPNRYCICPDTETTEPIEITILKEENTLRARITMKMTYRVIPADLVGPMANEAVLKLHGQRANVERLQAAEFKVVGTHSQRVSCDFIEANDIEGNVQLQVAKEDIVNV